MIKKIFSWHHLWVIGTVLLGAYLRLYRIADYLTFLGDEGRDVLVVKRMIVDGDFILLGPTASVGGFFLGPMYYYVMAPFLWLFRLDPVGPAVMVAVFGIVTIYLVYLVGKSLFHPVVGVTAATLYALSPLVIAYSRSSWNPNLVPFCSILLIYFLWRIAVKKTTLRDTGIVGLLWGLGIQFHYLFSFLMILSVIWIGLVKRPKQFVKHGIALIGGFFLTFSPFIAFEIRHGFQNLRSMIAFITKGNETGFSPTQFVTTVADVAFRSFGRLLFRLPNYDVWNSFPDWQVAAWVIATRTALFVTLGLLVMFIMSEWKRADHIAGIKKRFSLSREQWMGSILLFLWFGVSVLLFGLYRRGIYDYYFGIFYAFPFLGVGIMLWQLWLTKIGKVVSIGLFCGLMYYSWQGRPFVYPPNKQMEQTKTIAQAAVDMAQGQPFNFALLTATNSDHAYRYFFEIWDKKPVPLENIEKDPERKTVTHQLIVICEDPACHPLGHSQWEIAGFGRAEIEAEQYVFPVRIFRLIHYKEDIHE